VHGRHLSSSPLIATTRAGVEMTLIVGWLLIRAFDLSQALVSSLTGSLDKSSNASLDVGLLFLLTFESVLLGRWLVKKKSMRPLAWPLVGDYLFSLVTLGLTPLFTTPEGRLAVWTMWPYPVTLSTTVIVGAVCLRWWQALAGSGILAGVYLAVVAFPLTGDHAGFSTALANALAYPGFTLAVVYFAALVRNLASTADEAKARVAELERDRGRAIVHNLLAYLKLDHFVEANEETQLAMVAQARAKHDELRSYVDGTGKPTDVAALLHGAAALHALLAPRIVANLDSAVRISEETAERLERALDSALSNAEQHAPGSQVVISAFCNPEHVTVTVLDDGSGFNGPLLTAGFGIREILGNHLNDVGGQATVRSIPGGGTEVEIVVPRSE
jgi:hypothetical protein